MPLWFYGDSAAAVTITKTDGQQGANSYTVSLGTAFTGRVIVLAVTFAGVVASSITLAGNAMTKRVTGSGGASGDTHIWTITDSSNTTATLAFTGSGTANGFAIYSVSTSSEVPTATSGVAANNTTLTVLAKGGVIAAFFSNNSATGATWTGLTKDTDFAQGGETESAASAVFAAAQSPLSISVVSSGAVFRLASAAWGP
jgi:hypothetical protein